MKVYVKCKNCKNELRYSARANTRVELATKNGEYLILKCKNCGTEAEFHVDELYAQESRIAQIGAGIIFLIGTPPILFLLNPIFLSNRNHYAIYILGGFLLVPVFVYRIIQKQDQTRVSSFNRNNLKGRIHHIR